ncbi:MAG TPA: hypothetical protein VFB41_06055 [Solirubrobacteraceae bacterium]|nr:hypothetical protein [Solirubrobacteraceae bacterium]
MNAGTKRKIALGAIVATAAGGGAAWASASSKSDFRSEYLNDVAKRLDVTPEKLTSALKGAYLEQLDDAVKSGRLTQKQADALKQRAENGDVPLGAGPGFGHRLGPGKGFGHRHGGGPFGSTISAAATYLGLSETELQTKLRSGTSLADVAKEKGKSEDDLVDAIVAAETKQLDQAVTDKRITSEQRDAIAKNLPARIKALVEGGPLAGGPRGGPWGGKSSSGNSRPVPAPGAGAVL